MLTSCETELCYKKCWSRYIKDNKGNSVESGNHIFHWVHSGNMFPFLKIPTDFFSLSLNNRGLDFRQLMGKIPLQSEMYVKEQRGSDISPNMRAIVTTSYWILLLYIKSKLWHHSVRNGRNCKKHFIQKGLKYYKWQSKYLILWHDDWKPKLWNKKKWPLLGHGAVNNLK
jgi:hypothetical protein